MAVVASVISSIAIQRDYSLATISRLWGAQPNLLVSFVAKSKIHWPGRIAAFRRAIADWLQRIGGLPHWPAVQASGKINATWDEEFLDAFLENDRERLFAYRDHAIGEAGGPGGHEFRTWIVVAGCVAIGHVDRHAA